MNPTIEAIREQSRLIAEQNKLLRQLADKEMERLTDGEFEPDVHRRGCMISDREFQQILMSSDIMAAIDQWNAHYDRFKKGRKR